MSDRFYDYYNFPKWIISDWEKLFDLSRSYKRAIQLLLQKEHEGDYGISSERDIFPIMLLIHVYIELILKSFILKESTKLIPTHDLEQLLTEVKKLHKTLDFGDSKAFIVFLNNENPKAEAFRYNFDKSKKEYFVFKEKDMERGIYLSEIWTNFYNIVSIIENYYKKLKE